MVCVDQRTTQAEAAAKAFEAKFIEATKARNMKIWGAKDTTWVERNKTVTDAVAETVRKQGGLQLVVVLLSEYSKSVHAEVKTAGVEIVGVPTQCAIISKFMSFNTGVQMGYCKRILDKVNSKLSDYRCNNVRIGSTINWKVMVACDRPTLVLGIDLSSPEPKSQFPSVIAVAALLVSPGGCDCKYDVVHRKQLYNLIVGGLDTDTFESMITEVVVAARDRHQWKHPPQRVVVYRAGVSDSQFDQLFCHEVLACKRSLKILSTLQEGNQAAEPLEPQLMYIVCQKNPGQRFVPLDSDRTNERAKFGFEGGLLNDSKAVVDPNKDEFFLQSHHAAIGTPKPVRYAALTSDFVPKLPTKEFQRLTYDLTYCWSRSTSSVSIVAPVRVAHLEAVRVRASLAIGIPRDVAAGLGSAAGRGPDTDTVNIHKNMQMTQRWD